MPYETIEDSPKWEGIMEGLLVVEITIMETGGIKIPCLIVERST